MNRLRMTLVSLSFVASIALSGEGDIAQVGSEAPQFSGLATDGSTIGLSAYKGKVVVVGFFATWCGGCVAEMPRIDREVAQSGVNVIEVGRGHSFNELAPFKRRNGFSFTILEDPRREIYNKYATAFIPRCYVIGKDGRVKYAMTGTGEADFAEMKRHVAEELKSEPSK